MPGVFDERGQLPRGLYEQIVSREIDRVLTELRSQGFIANDEELDGADSHEVLSHYVYTVLRRALHSLPHERRVERQVELCNEVIKLLSDSDVLINEPALRLLALLDPAGVGVPQTLPRPHVPLSASDLLVNARGEPSVGHALEREIPSADSVDLLCAFVRWNGLRLILPQLKAHCETGKTVRVITTTYTGSTERRALDELVRIGARVKISYETRSTRLHAKAWLFHRATGYSTAYIGSSNLTHWALVEGLEWNVRLSQVTSPDILDKFRATFESYWEEREFENYDPARDRERFDRAVSSITTTDSILIAAIDIIPYPHQQQILERLEVERERHQRYRSLIVAATGTGKTIVAALDYRRLRTKLGNPRLLFVAHRKELLGQSLSVFRQVLRDGAFGELYVDGHRPDEWRHVFASVQSLAQLDLSEISASAFDVIIVDEFHHAAAATYRRLLEHFQPKILLGLTATPERADGRSILEWFDGRIAIELRLWEALERGLLCPFHYFGIHDETDLSRMTWSRRGYDVGELETLYTADDARVRLIIQAVLDKIAQPQRMRALGFCVSIAHAEFMARKFNQAAIRALAISSESSREVRDGALRQLRNGEVSILFAVDLFNEGVDVPEVDTVLFLRPTESATVFLQQLGRGLRQSEGKSCLTVLDFIGKASRRFRFDLRYRAMTDATRATVQKSVEQGFPYLPAGCKIQLDRVAAGLILENLKESIGSRFQTLIDELRQYGDVSLREFISEAGIEMRDLYRNPEWTWSRLRREAGFTVPAAGPNEKDLGKGLSRLVHTDDRSRLTFLNDLITAPSPPDTHRLGVRERRTLLGLHFTLLGNSIKASELNEALSELWAHPAVLAELREMLAVLEDEASHLTRNLEPQERWSSIPLSVHASYNLEEILTAFGEMSLEKPHRIREGTTFNDETKSDLFFVTFEKSEKQYSPTTMYKDYAISPELLHWESQSITSQKSSTGQRYIHHRSRETNILIFARRTQTLGGRTAPYMFLGPADYVSHQGDRPVSFVWRLRTPMPADFFRGASVAAG